MATSSWPDSIGMWGSALHQAEYPGPPPSRGSSRVLSRPSIDTGTQQGVGQLQSHPGSTRQMQD